MDRGLAAGTSIHLNEHLKYCHHTDFEGELYVIVRDPRARVMSAWQNKVHDQAGEHKFFELGVKPYAPIDDFTDALPAIYDKEAHIAPQEPEVAKVAHKARVIPLEALPEVWAGLQQRFEGLPDLERRNATSAPPPPERTRKLIEKLYADDMRLWREVSGDFGGY